LPEEVKQQLEAVRAARRQGFEESLAAGQSFERIWQRLEPARQQAFEPIRQRLERAQPAAGPPADMRRTLDAIQAFANEHGGLGVGPTELRGPRWPRPVVGESYLAWVDEIVRMRRLLAVWEAVQADDEGKLRGHVKWTRWRRRRDGVLGKDEPVWVAEGDWQRQHPGQTPSDADYEVGWTLAWDWLKGKHPGTDAHPSAGYGLGDRMVAGMPSLGEPTTTPPWEPGSVLEPARSYVRGQVSQRLTGLRVELAPDGTRPGLAALCLRPANLCDALYLSFACELMGGGVPRRCANPKCLKWFVPGRKDQDYCRPSCGLRAWRARRETDRSRA